MLNDLIKKGADSMNIIYIEEERQLRAKSSNLKLIYNHWSYDSVDDDEVARVLKPVLAMINAGTFNKNKQNTMVMIANNICS